MARFLIGIGQMRMFSVILMLAACSHGAAHPAGSPAPSSPYSLVIANAQLFGSTGDAVAVSSGKIAQIGASAELLEACTGSCERVDAQGGFLLPGFHDAHVHPLAAGEESFELQVRGAALADIQAAVKAYATMHPADAWLVGRGWNSAAFSTLPTASDLDAAESSRPVALVDHTGHNVWVNSAALAAAGITDATPNPPGGTIHHPLGVLEDGAQSLINAVEPEPTDDQLVQWILKGQSLLLDVGCTSTEGGGTVSLREAKMYQTLDQMGQLKQRIFLWARLGVSDDDFAAWKDFAGSLAPDGLVQLVAFKGFADGTIAVRTAALLKPYADAPSTSGRLSWTQDGLDKAVLRANGAGFPVAIHAIGDRAVRQVLDAFENSKTVLGHSLINRVEHATVVDPSDAPRFGALGVAASVQPVWLYGYPSAAGFVYAARLGPDRVGSSYAWRTLQAGGATLLFGSDLPSSDLYDPVSGVFAATARQFQNGEVFAPEQALEPDDALRAYTENAPAIYGWGDRLGKLAVGYLADLILLDHDPRTGAKSLKDDPLSRIWLAGVEVPRD